MMRRVLAVVVLEALQRAAVAELARRSEGATE